MTISVLAYRSAAVIQRCVDSAFEVRHGGPLEVVVREQGGDRHEHALLLGMAAAAEARGRRLRVSRGSNLGFGAGHNLAIERTGGDFVVVLNADARLSPGYLEAALPAFGRDRRVGAVQGKVRRDGRPGPPVVDTAGLRPLRNRRFVGRGQGEADLGQFDAHEEIFGPDGAVATFRRTALADVAVPLPGRVAGEVFDESFFAYKEDVDLAWRLQLRGWKTAYVPEALAWHLRSARETTAAPLRQLLGERRRMPATATFLGFTNHRLTQLKNERLADLALDVLPWLGRELPAWAVELTGGRRPWQSAVRIARLAPPTWRKRRWIQGRRVPGADLRRWFDPARDAYGAPSGGPAGPAHDRAAP